MFREPCPDCHKSVERLCPLEDVAELFQPGVANFLLRIALGEGCKHSREFSVAG